jgi:hypothetical protein
VESRIDARRVTFCIEADDSVEAFREEMVGGGEDVRCGRTENDDASAGWDSAFGVDRVSGNGAIILFVNDEASDGSPDVDSEGACADEDGIWLGPSSKSGDTGCVGYALDRKYVLG